VVLAKKGLQGASFSKILEESGAPRGSLYHHFRAVRTNWCLKR